MRNNNKRKKVIYLLFICLPYFADCMCIWSVCIVLQLNGSPQGDPLVWITWYHFLRYQSHQHNSIFGLS